MSKITYWKCRYGHLSPKSASRCEYPGCGAELYMDPQACLVEADVEDLESVPASMEPPPVSTESFPGSKGDAAASPKKRRKPWLTLMGILSVCVALRFGLLYYKALSESASVAEKYRKTETALTETKQSLNEARKSIQELEVCLSESQEEAAQQKSRARMRGLLDSVLLEHEEQGLPLLRFRYDLERAAVLNNTPPSGGDYLRTLARNLRNYFDGQDIYLRTGDGVTVNRRRVRELYPVLAFLGEYDKAANVFRPSLY